MNVLLIATGICLTAVSSIWFYRAGENAQHRADQQLLDEMRRECGRLRRTDEQSYLQGFADGEAFERTLRQAPSPN